MGSLAVRRVGFAGMLLLAPGFARAQAPGADSATTAEAAFDEARQLMAEARYAEACPKFAESHRLDPGIGILIYLGDCYEKNGQTASAWATFREVIPLARAADQRERERVARDRAAELEPKLVKLVVVIASERAEPGLEIRRDGIILGPALWGSAIPVDPGRHVIEATATGRDKWSRAVDVEAGEPAVTVTVPSLERRGPPDGATRRVPAPDHSSPRIGPPDVARWSTQSTAAIVVGALGAAGLVVGTSSGVATLSSWDKVRDDPSCHGSEPVLCDAGAKSSADAAQTSATIATIGFVGGGVAAAVAVVLWLTAPKTGSNVGRGRSLHSLRVTF